MAAKLRERSRTTGKSFIEVVNAALRLGLTVRQDQPDRPFRFRPRPLGLRPGLSLDNVAELVEQLEGEQHR